MHSLIHRLSFAWLILAIVTAPLQALALPAPDDERMPDCEMHAGDQADEQKNTEPHCPACVDHECEGAGCSGLNCTATHLQSGISNGLTAGFSRSVGRLLLRPDRVLTSLELSPLDRPPAV